MKKRDKQIVLLIIVIAFLCLVGYKFFERESSDSNYVVIALDGQEYKRVSLSEPQTVVVDHEGKHNEIEITKEGVSMHSSNCYNQNCIMQGEATLENIDERIMGGWIVCLPNGVSIELVKGESNEN
jgi:hypothetical protein